ncbi:hypothetical protein [Mucilaginibacter sp.]|jgi:hypothetical protein|uniref:hypothetical protein n=1 Tax=Mucilaginibacter sp. TaxID=1882438 RepID=UPI0025D4938E|nr:hypothetical protein [Mucilaginibacter sp.]
MEIQQENLLSIIREKCSSGWQLDVFRDHIIINLPDNEKDFRLAYSKAKEQITACIQQHFPERNEDVLFEVRNGSWNCSFKLGKTVA